MARPSRLSPAKQEILVRELRGGTPLALAAGLAHVSRRTVFYWLARGEKDREAGRCTPYAAFARDARWASALFAQTVLATCRRAMLVGDVSAATLTTCHWILARRFPEHFGPGRRHGEEVSRRPTREAPDGTQLPRIVVVHASHDTGDGVGYAAARHPCPEELGDELSRFSGRR